MQRGVFGVVLLAKRCKSTVRFEHTFQTLFVVLE